MKKTLTLLFCLLMVLALLAGCTDTGDTSTTTPDGKKIITIGLPKSTRVTDYSTNSYTLWLEEVSGCEIEFVMYATASSDYEKQLSTDTAGDMELPDILLGLNLSEAMVRDYGEDGYFIDLSKYFNDREKSANFWYMMETYLSEEEQEKVWQNIHAKSRDDSEDLENSPIYCLPTMETTLIDTMDFIPLINQEWLDRLKLDAPTTPDELLTVLRKFKAEDANGNGDPNDEYPLLGPAGDALSYGGSTIDWLINFFIYQNDAYNFNIDANGKLYLPYDQPKYKEALQYIHTLYEEGLMHQATLTANYKGVKPTLMNTDTVGVTLIHPSQGFDMTSEAICKWSALNLYGNVYYNDNAFSRNVFITDDCDDPDAAWDLLMHMYTYESAVRQRYGEKGVDWDWADEGATSVMGLTATIKVYGDIWGTNNNKSWNALRGGIFPYSENECNQPTGQESKQLQHKYDLYKELTTNFNAALDKVDQSLVCPWLRFSDEEDDMSPYRDDLKTAIDSWQKRFINGDKNLDTDWDDYLDELDDLGIDDYIAAGQHCYDRMYKSGT